MFRFRRVLILTNLISNAGDVLHIICRLQLKIGAEPTQLNLPCCLYVNDTCDISNDDILIFKRERNKYLYIFGFLSP